MLVLTTLVNRTITAQTLLTSQTLLTVQTLLTAQTLLTCQTLLTAQTTHLLGLNEHGIDLYEKEVHL